jgi:phosphoglycerate dehydrogenase-like enzyme
VQALPPGSNADAVADMTWGLMLAVARKITRADALVRSGRWQTLGGVSLYEKTLGILGFGAIGQAVARRAVGFRMRVLAGNRNPQKYQPIAESMGVQLVPLETLLAESDFLTIHLPLTDETRAMISHQQLGMMKQGAILINTSRGAVVDEKALCCALQDAWIGGAGLDVFDTEPLPQDSCLRYATNCVLTPHIAARAVESDRFVGIHAARVVLDALGVG